MDWDIFAGLLGGAAVECLTWYSRRETLRDNFPNYARHYGYWLSTLVMILFGGAVVFIYKISGIDIKPIVALNIGASAPSIISAAAKAAPPKITV